MRSPRIIDARIKAEMKEIRDEAKIDRARADVDRRDLLTMQGDIRVIRQILENVRPDLLSQAKR